MTSETWRTQSYLDQMDLSGKGFVVLGVGTGIGGQVCRALSEAGARLICVDVRADMADRAAADSGGIPIVADITDRAEMTAIFARAHAEFGQDFEGAVDVVGVTRPGLLAMVGDEAIAQQFDLVFRHALLTIQIAAPMLAALGRGSITLIGSISGITSQPRIALYGAAKAALHHLVAEAAHEFGPSGVRINAVAPGRIIASGSVRPTEQALQAIAAAVPLRRPGVPSDIAGVVLFLASGLAAYVTGTVIRADGGIGMVSALPGSQG
jgi:NAD(P)-dependent dehydrogenase (short-subunit alcohol dehydrogenase family)